MIDDSNNNKLKTIIDKQFNGGEVSESDETMVYNYLRKQFKTRGQEIMNSFMKDGFDAIIDPEDWYVGWYNRPMIIGNPQESLRLVKEKIIRN